MRPGGGGAAAAHAGAGGRGDAALAEALFPLLAALLSASGAANTASLLTPSAALLNRLIIELFSGAGLRLCGVAAAVSVAGGIHSRITLKGLFALLSDVVNWTAGIVVTAFLGFLSVQRLLGGGYDSASVRAARYAVDNLLPVIGGDVADTLDVVISSVRLVKNALGVTGMLLALGLCAGPVAAIGLALISMRVLAAVTEPLAEDGLSRMMEQFAKVLRMLLVLDSACATLLLLLLGASLAAGGRLSG